MPDCKHCPKRNGCVGLQYDCYCMSYRCPYDKENENDRDTNHQEDSQQG